MAERLLNSQRRLIRLSVYWSGNEAGTRNDALDKTKLTLDWHCKGILTFYFFCQTFICPYPPEGVLLELNHKLPIAIYWMASSAAFRNLRIGKSKVWKSVRDACIALFDSLAKFPKDDNWKVCPNILLHYLYCSCKYTPGVFLQKWVNALPWNICLQWVNLPMHLCIHT